MLIPYLSNADNVDLFNIKEDNGSGYMLDNGLGYLINKLAPFRLDLYMLPKVLNPTESQLET